MSSLLLPFGLFGFICVLAIALSHLIDKPAPGRNFLFSFFIGSMALGFIYGLAPNNSIQIGSFKLGFAFLIIFASLIGIFTESVLVTIYRGDLRAGFFSGGLTGVTAFFIGRLLPPSNLGYQDFHDLPSLIRIGIPFAVGVVSYVLIANKNDQQDNPFESD